ncbi:hypothetical protein [Synechococcus phage S-N03]|uniref:DUF6321 domain-containing protein n=1 Tax=Synechococcus phage S-N03 TaxID=2718943 RepID=A0A6G8R650_9CAUD|nr:hypothetical protein PQC09_gp205 [Synechococcus phage S-N03]QIN96862.1 hypothetical protein [Synechococcus phage S-N03]
MSDQNSISDFLDGMTSASADVDAVISEGLSNMKSKISKVEVKLESKEDKKEEPKPEAKPSTELADKAINTYKTKIKPATGVEAGELEVSAGPSTKASRELMKATIRALTNRQGSGDCGKTSHVGPNGSGNVGTPGPAPIVVAPLSMEEYRAQVFESFGLVAEEQDGPEPTAKERKGAVRNIKANLNQLQNKEDDGEKLTKKEKHALALQKARAKAWGMKEDLDVVSILEDSLLASDATDWMQVDYVARQVCLENHITLKELNKAFKDVHGKYPDKWIKEQTEITQCGWMPLDEATRVNKVGLVYEVSFMHRGKMNRYKFFWPQISRPTKEEMQKTIEGFYPKAKVLAFYPAAKQDDNFMVIVPPMSEHVEVLRWDNWTELTEDVNEAYHNICEEVGEPITSVVELEEGYSVIVEDHDTGERVEVEFHEDWQKVNRNDKTDGMSDKAVKAYRRENPGSKLQTAVTEKNPTGKRAQRRKNFCSRSRGWDGERGKAARARWNC